MYIRTKDGRILDFDKLNEISKLSIDMAKEPIREAKTIEELCDMTIVVDDERPDSVFELEWYIDEDLINKYKDVKGVYVYGAIWTSKGLIYVAKLNQKGVLELL